MAKKITRIAKLQFEAGKAKPGPELAGLGIDMVGFSREFNEATKDRLGTIVPVEITAFSDRSYKFKLKTTPAAFLILQAAGVKKGSNKANSEKIGQVTVSQLLEIAKYKMPDLNTMDLDKALSMLKGTARNIGIEVIDDKGGTN